MCLWYSVQWDPPGIQSEGAHLSAIHRWQGSFDGAASQKNSCVRHRRASSHCHPREVNIYISGKQVWIIVRILTAACACSYIRHVVFLIAVWWSSHQSFCRLRNTYSKIWTVTDCVPSLTKRWKTPQVTLEIVSFLSSTDFLIKTASKVSLKIDAGNGISVNWPCCTRHLIRV